jgi:hypothetical protein
VARARCLGHVRGGLGRDRQIVKSETILSSTPHITSPSLPTVLDA